MNPQLAARAGAQAGPPAVPDPQPQQQGAGKVSAQNAEYIDQAGTCATCSHFLGDGQPCAVVADPVAAGGWCKLFESGQPGMTDNDADDQGPAAAGDQGAPGAPADGTAL